MFNRYAPLLSSTVLAVVAVLRFLGQSEAADATERASESAAAAYVALAAAAGTLYGAGRKLVSIARSYFA